MPLQALPRALSEVPETPEARPPGSPEDYATIVREVRTHARSGSPLTLPHAVQLSLHSGIWYFLEVLGVGLNVGVLFAF